MENRTELLAPAGSYEGMTAAFSAGADAVYIGGTRFGARAYAENPDGEGLKRAIQYAHMRKRKLYLTVNTLLKDAEMEELYHFLNPLYMEGLDAVIVQDMGVLRYVRDVFPGLHIHASTQMGITGAYGAEFLKKEGASRVVLARELSLSEIRAVDERTDVELECFVHGALCFCYSGQCLFSSMVGGRSGNRGRCAQPCRLSYDLLQNGSVVHTDGSYLLSPKDICTLDQIPALIKSGVDSMKIEGRMKRPEYAAGVVRAYRRAIDRFLESGQNPVAPQERKELLDLYRRRGYCEGYYFQHNGRDMMALDKSGKTDEPGQNEKLLQNLKEQYLFGEDTVKINGKLILSKRKPAILEVYFGDVRSTVCGMQPQAAKTRPLTEEEAKKQIRKTGGSGFSFEKLELEMEEDLFLPLQALNELRRKALDAFREKLRERDLRGPGKTRALASAREESSRTCAIHVSVENRDSLSQLCAIPQIDAIYIDCSAFSSREDFLASSGKQIELCHASKKRCLYIMPWIFRAKALQYYRWEDAGPVLEQYDGVLLRSQEEYAFLTAHGYRREMAADWNLYTFNREAQAFWREKGLAFDTVPPELNFREIQKRGCGGSELIVYGYQPLMVSAQCQQKNSIGCKKRTQILFLRDRKKKRFAVKNICMFCYNIIYNSVPLELADHARQIQTLRPSGVRLQFTAEEKETVLCVTKAYIAAFCGQERPEREIKEFTRGHFERGVE